MACKPRSFWHSRKGFSLIELSMVLVAAGMMVGMGSQILSTKTVTTTDNEAAIKKCYSDTRASMSSMNNALQQFFLRNGYYPMPSPINSSTSGTQISVTNVPADVITAAAAGTVVVDNAGAPTIAIGHFPYTTVGLPPQYFKDCFSTKGIVITSYTNTSGAGADENYRYAVSLDSVTKMLYSNNTTHGALKINTSTSASLNTKAIYAIISHGSTGCAGSLTTAKSMNCTTNPFTGVANNAFSRNPGDPQFFDDLVFYYSSKDGACGAQTVSWKDNTTNLICSYASTVTVKSGTTITVTNSASLMTGSASATCQLNGTSYALSASGSCQCGGTVANGSVISQGGVCVVQCQPNFTASGNSCVPNVTGVCNNAAPASCSDGTVINDNGDNGCGHSRTWICQGTGTGGNSGTCSFTNAACSIDCGWSAWSACSAPCGNTTGTQTRTRDNPPASNGGANCTGPESQTCGPTACPTCSATAPTGGSLTAYPGCQPTCPPPSTLNGSSCVTAGPNVCTATAPTGGSLTAYPDCQPTCPSPSTLNVSSNSCVSSGVPGNCPSNIIYMYYDFLVSGTSPGSQCPAAGYTDLIDSGDSSDYDAYPTNIPTNESLCIETWVTGGTKGNHDGSKYNMYRRDNSCAADTGSGNCSATVIPDGVWNNSTPIKTTDLYTSTKCTGGGAVPNLTNGQSWTNDNLYIWNTGYNVSPNWYNYTAEQKVTATCNNGVVTFNNSCTITPGAPTYSAPIGTAPAYPGNWSQTCPTGCLAAATTVAATCSGATSTCDPKSKPVDKVCPATVNCACAPATDVCQCIADGVSFNDPLCQQTSGGSQPTFTWSCGTLSCNGKV